MILPFSGKTQRALVVIPGSEDGRDFCSVVPGGFTSEDAPSIRSGPLWMVLCAARECGNGLPITVHPECKRRAGQ